MSNLDTVLAYLRNTLGLSPAQAAGVAGNLEVESHLNPDAVNASEGAHGIAQWEGGRWTELQQFAAQNGTQPTDLTTQLEFLGNELHGSESGALSQLLATNTPDAAAAAFDQYYERSSGGSRQQRIADAESIAAGNDPGSATGPSSSTSSSSGGDSIADSIGGWMGLGSTFFTIGVKVAAAAAAGALVIVGAMHTVSDN